MSLLSRIRRFITPSVTSEPGLAVQLYNPNQSTTSNQGANSQWQRFNQSTSITEDVHHAYVTSSMLAQAGQKAFAEIEGVLSLTIMDWQNHIATATVQDISDANAKSRSVGVALVTHTFLKYLTSLSSAPFLHELLILTNNVYNLITPLTSDQLRTDDGNYWMLHLVLDPERANLPVVRERIVWWSSQF